MNIDQYIKNINQRYLLGNATEHTFRGDLQQLIESLVPAIRATNEPKRQSCGAPDYIITKKDIPVGFIEAKDIGDSDLEGSRKIGNKEQFDRYKASLNNIIFTDYLNFLWYKDAQLVMSVKIAELENGKVRPLNQNFQSFERMISEFCTTVGQTIKSSKKLAEMMAGKARLLADVIEKALNSDEKNNENSTIKSQLEAFKDVLIHDITPRGFADVYAQTIAYGMFAARLHDPTMESFSRQEAAELIPRTNPFLRKLFGYIAGPDIDDRIKWIVDNLAEIFLACNVAELLKDYGKATKTEDPIIHYYETFLSEYDPSLRKARGVWYTPQPVVNFIVRAVDEILKTEFGLSHGIADTSKTKVKVKAYTKTTADKRSKTKEIEHEVEVHKVQILDPATGTGTFLAETIKLIHKSFEGQQGIWSNYVDNHLLPRLNGFEILMASYAMAHLKLDLLLSETGYKSTKEQRFKVYLTNSLEEYNQDTGTLFANWLSIEANEANHIKRDAPVMVVMGNPPYAVSSTNKNKWIESLTADYKKNLNEKSFNSLSDDYVKFIRFGQHFIQKNGSGVLAYISNNSFVDGIVFRQMRNYLLECFDKIYILDLHGNAKKKEICPDGSSDQNVFDIMQGVSISLFIKTGKKDESALGKIFHADLFGDREFKYQFLFQNTIESIKWIQLQCFHPNYYFVNKNFENKESYESGFRIDSLFNINSVGIVTSKDAVLISDSILDLRQKVVNYYNIEFNHSLIKTISYRVFDNRYIYYDTKLVDRARYNVMQHLLYPNVSLIAPKQAISGFQHVFISNTISDKNYIDSAGQFGAGNVFPLYIYSEQKAQLSISEQKERILNLNFDIVAEIASNLNLAFVMDESIILDSFDGIEGAFYPLDLLDYIYAVLHSPTYREKYKEFLKIDFPRVPYPKDADTFLQLVKLGGELRQIHLLESPVVDHYITQYPADGDNIVVKIAFKEGNVYINDTQHFANVPEIAWNFYIGGYQPAQKWLKDRKGRTLQFDDILHYQKIIVALTETDRLMKEIDAIEI